MIDFCKILKKFLIKIALSTQNQKEIIMNLLLETIYYLKIKIIN